MATTLNPYGPQIPRSKLSLYVLTRHALNFQTQQLSAPLLSCLLSNSLVTLCACSHISSAVSSHPHTAQPAESRRIFNSLEAEGRGISSTCSRSWLASSVLTRPSENCNSQNICTYCAAQATGECCLKGPRFPHGAGYSLNNAARMQRDAGTELLAPAGPALG